MLYPLLLKPIYQDYLWGGREIVTKYDREAPAQKRYAESWEICDREEENSVVTNGALAGTSLRALLSKYPFEMYGTHDAPPRFPLLIKLIDAHENLSIQVHPDELTAEQDNTEPKTECWYILDAQKGALVYAGLKQPLTPAQFQKLAGTDDLVHALHECPVKSGDVFFIPGGRLHAIGAGILLLEVQQNANTTYRVYDWERTDDTGQPRELHLEKAKDAVHLDDTASPRVTFEPVIHKEPVVVTPLLENTHFTMKHVLAQEDLRLNKTESGCEILFFEHGEGTLRFENHTLAVTPGMSVLIPHICKKVTLETNGIRFVAIRPVL